MPTSFISLSMHLLHVSRGLPLPLEPCGFHWRACRVILFLPFLNVCPTHFHLRLHISVCIGTCPVLSHSCSFLILSVHFSFKIFLEHLFTNTWSLFMTPCDLRLSYIYLFYIFPYTLRHVLFCDVMFLEGTSALRWICWGKAHYKLSTLWLTLQHSDLNLKILWFSKGLIKKTKWLEQQ